ncbi:MAG: hypothetical protein AAF330_02780 [Pseudomonadota bacterium]
MTALKRYARLETVGMWRAAPGEQLRDVTVKLGEASLILTDKAGRALAHWSLAAVTERRYLDGRAVFSPDGRGQEGETLELEDPTMIGAINEVRRSLARRRPNPGRLRLYSLFGSLGLVLVIALFWAPGALVRYTAAAVPEAKRTAFDLALRQEFIRLAGAPCQAPFGSRGLRQLEVRLGLAPRGLAIHDLGTPKTISLPGGTLLVDRRLVEDAPVAEVVAGYILSAQVAADVMDPLAAYLHSAGPRVGIGLLTRGELASAAMRDFAEFLMTNAGAPPDVEQSIASFQGRGVAPRPYALALDVTGESVLPLVEAQSFPPEGGWRPVLADGPWLALQSICDG